EKTIEGVFGLNLLAVGQRLDVNLGCPGEVVQLFAQCEHLVVIVRVLRTDDLRQRIEDNELDVAHLSEVASDSLDSPSNIPWQLMDDMNPCVLRGIVFEDAETIIDVLGGVFERTQEDFSLLSFAFKK